MPTRRERGFEHPHASEITPEVIYRERRAWIAQAMAWGAAGLATTTTSQAAGTASATPLAHVKSELVGAQVMDTPTALADATSYNNFYEFGTDKDDPAKHAHTLRTRPWTVVVDGEVRKPQTLDIDALLKLAPIEERTYRLRCVEGWSMVIPWLGWSLSHLIKRVEPTGNAKFVEFTTLADPQQMPGVNQRVLKWPYTEGLRLDEALHPLTLISLGMYGQMLPNQNGAPVRLVVPWKYGFKSAKSLVRIRLVERQPRTSWETAIPSEYGFFSNVNPEVDHPRWSQASERRIGEDSLFAKKRKTLMFNGYEAQVGQLYTGMDLRKFF